MRLFSILFVTLFICANTVSAQAQKVVNCWTTPQKSALRPEASSLRIKPENYHLMQLDTLQMKSALASAPQEFTQNAKAKPLLITLPTPDGGLATFRVQAVQTMAPALADKFPSIKTYGGQGVEDPTVAIRLDYTELGFHAMVLDNNRGHYFIDPAYKNNQTIYLSYYKKDLKKNELFEEGLIQDINSANSGTSTPQAKPPVAKCIGNQLRTYRAAVACTGEYAVAATGVASPTKAQTLSAIVTSMNRVTGIYEKEVAIRLQLVANNDLVVFTNANTDPFAGNNTASTLINESQTNIANLIGEANFDIGHTFSTGGGGLAQLGCVCKAGNKARGITGSPSPVGDAYDVDYVAHEMGHQFGGEHTFNANTGSCSGNGSTNTNAEPGSGTTIMAYAGICNTQNDLQANSDAMFHAISFDQIINYSNLSNGNSCAVITATGNQPPVVNAGKDFYIPYKTAFTLTGSASDPDGDALTYAWEQTNTGGTFSNWNAPTGNAPIFRSFSPVTSQSRTFPKLADIIANKTTIGELLPSYARVLEFRLTARDNKNNGGGVCYDVMNVNVINTTNPFSVTYPNAAVVWNVGEYRNVTWNVSNTDLSPIRCSAVAIELSTDGGLTYPIVLKDSTPNSGSAGVLVPNNTTSKARIRIRALGNVFFDISNINFTIRTPLTTNYALNYPAQKSVCAGGNPSFVINVGAVGSFSSPVNFSASGLPGATTASFSKNGILPNDSTVVTLDNTGALVPGTYSFTITAVGDTSTQTRTLSFKIVALTSFTTNGVSPAAKSIGQIVNPLFSWGYNSNANSYDLAVATDSLFTNTVYTASVPDTFHTSSMALLESEDYYWKIRPVSNLCGGIVGQYSTPIRFKTGAKRCNTLTKTGAPSTISPTTSATINLSLVEPVDSTGVITDINVVGLKIQHSSFSDLRISLVSPKGTIALLASDVCDSAQIFNLSFDDDATLSGITCNSSTPETVKPAESLSIFNGESPVGQWRLRIFDQYVGNGGSVTTWGVQICRSALIPLPVDWLKFTGVKLENNSVQLKWQTANEINNKKYSVERSNDGVHFESIGLIEGAKSSKTVNDYFFTDASSKTGVVYYRVKQTDVNGAFTYTNIISFTFESSAEISLFPNPAKNVVLIKSPNKMDQIQLFGVNGKLIFTAKPNTNTITFPVSKYTPGTYSVRIITSTSVINKQLIIQ